MILPDEERRLLDVLQQAGSLQLYRLQAMLGKMLEDPKRIIEVRRLLHLGQSIRYLDVVTGQMRTAQILDLRDRELVVREAAGQQRMLRLPYVAVEPPFEAPHGHGQPPAAAVPDPALPRREDFQRGQKVSFEDRHLHTQVGVITRINQRTASIDTGDGMVWKVSFGLLRHVVDV